MTNNTKTREAHDAYVANRKEAGRVIDIETCEMACWRTNYFDPHLTEPWDDPPLMLILICTNNAGRIIQNVGLFAVKKVVAGSFRVICRKRSGKRCSVGSSASKSCMASFTTLKSRHARFRAPVINSEAFAMMNYSRWLQARIAPLSSVAPRVALRS